MKEQTGPLYDYFEPHIIKQRRQLRIFSLLMVFVGVGTLVATWSNPSADARLHAAGLLATPVARILLFISFRKHRGLAALAKPDDIVWFYGLSRGGAVNTLMVGTKERKLHRFSLPLKSRKEGFSMEAFALIRAHCPKATDGYSEQTRVQFLKDPASLLKA